MASSSSLPLLTDIGTRIVGTDLPLDLAPLSNDQPVGSENTHLIVEIPPDVTSSHRLSAVVPSGATVQGDQSLPAMPPRSKGARVPLVDVDGLLAKGSVPEASLDRSRSPRGPQRFDLSPRSLHAPAVGDLSVDDMTMDLSANLSLIMDESAVRHGRAMEEQRTMNEQEVFAAELRQQFEENILYWWMKLGRRRRFLKKLSSSRYSSFARI